MSVLGFKHIKTKTSSEILLSLLFLFFFVTFVDCIKFGRVQPNNNSPQTAHQVQPQIELQQKQKTPLPQNEQKSSDQIVKPQLDNKNPTAKQQPQKTEVISPQGSQSPISYLFPKKKSQATKQSLNTIDDLFKTEKSKLKESQQNIPALLITPAQQKNEIQTVPAQTTSTTPVSKETTKKDKQNNILTGLFEQINAQTKTSDEKKKQNKPTAYSAQQQAPQVENKKSQDKEKINKRIRNQNKDRKVQKPLSNDAEKQQQMQKEETKNKVSQRQSKPHSKEQQDEQLSEQKQQNQNQKQKQENSEEQSDEIIYPNKMNIKKPYKQFSSKKSAKTPTVESPEQKQSKFSLTLLFTFCLYSLIIFMVIATLKCTSTSTKAAQAVNIMVDTVGDMFKKKKGYRPALNEEQITEREEQITVGYKVEDNKQIFWQKNSVEGI